MDANHLPPQPFLTPVISHPNNLTVQPFHFPLQKDPTSPRIPIPTRNSHSSPSHPPTNISQPKALTVRHFCGPSASESHIAPVQEAVCAQPTFGGVGLGPVLVPLEHCRCTAGLVGASEEPRATGSHIHRCGHVSCYTQRCPSQPTAARAGACQESGPSPGAGRRADTGSFA